MQTYADHLKASAEIQKHIEEADALAKKLAAMLSKARDTLETLKVFAPDDRFKITAPYHLRTSDNPAGNEASMGQLIERQVKAINATLGDRAS